MKAIDPKRKPWAMLDAVVKSNNLVARFIPNEQSARHLRRKNRAIASGKLKLMTP